MRYSADAALDSVLSRLEIGADALLGHGGEALVYALDADRVARIYHPGANPVTVDERAALLRELGNSAHHVPFAIPEVLETHTVDGRMATIERRLPGRPLNEVLGEAAGEARTRLIHAYLDAAARIGDLRIDRPWVGDLMGGSPIRTTTFGDYLTQRAARSLAAAGNDFAQVDAQALAAALPEPATGELVHLDAFPGNMLSDGESITAVVDFGVVAIIGDRRLDPLSAAAYLTPAITPVATDEDRRLAHAWLAERDLSDLFIPAQRWIAAFWSFAYDDEPLYEWCQSILLAR
jgi:aminoglycoside phosphotransferase (APT) family kinase protein